MSQQPDPGAMTASPPLHSSEAAARPRAARRRPAWGYCAVLAGLLLLLAAGSLLIAFRTHGVDDAYISYRYAHNLAKGHGLVFNPHEAPVQGYSNLLYTVMVAGAFAAGLEGDGVYWCSAAANVVASCVLLLVMAAYLRRRHGGEAAWAGGLLLAACPALWYWNASGLETMWVLLFQVLAWIAVEELVEGGRKRRILLASLAAIVLVFLRADGFIVPVLLVLYLLLRRRWRAALTLFGATGAAALALALLQLHLYGQPLPNTVYVKIGGGLLLRLGYAFTVLSLCRQMYPYWLVLVFLTISAAAAWDRDRRFARVPAGVFLSLCLVAYYLYVGGDFLGERFLLLLIPIAVCGLFSLRLAPARPAARAYLLALLLVSQLAMRAKSYASLGVLLFNPTVPHVETAWRDLGLFLRQREPGKSIAVDAAGIIPFYSGLRTIDMLGLSDYHIAHLPPSAGFRAGHNKYDPDYIMRRRPDLIAAWLEGERGDLRYGLGRRLWKRKYEIKYLLYIGPAPRPSALPEIVDATGITREHLTLMTYRGYAYAVLKRRPR